MNSFIKKYTEIFLGFIGALLSLIVLALLVWGVALAGRSMNQAFGSPDAGSGRVNFELGKAKMLDLKGFNR